MKDKLYLRNLISEYDFIKSQTITDTCYEETSDGDGDYSYEESHSISLYQDKVNNNHIVFINYDDTTVDSTCNGIRNTAYNYLINILNNNTDVLVVWSQIEGTTSDYTIYHNISKYIKSFNDSLENLIYNIYNISTVGDKRYKYIEIKNGIATKLEV